MYGGEWNSYWPTSPGSSHCNRELDQGNRRCLDYTTTALKQGKWGLLMKTKRSMSCWLRKGSKYMPLKKVLNWTLQVDVAEGGMLEDGESCISRGSWISVETWHERLTIVVVVECGCEELRVDVGRQVRGAMKGHIMNRLKGQWLSESTLYKQAWHNALRARGVTGGTGN